MDTFVVKYRPFKPRAANPPGTTASALKRGAPDSESETRLPKKQKRPYHRHHRLQAPLDLQVEGSVIPDGASVDQLFNFSLGQALREAGFEHADPVALDGFQSCVEAHMLHLLSYIRTSMTSGRRTQPLPIDFEFALRQNGISIDSLRPHVKPPPATRKALPVLPTPPPEEPIASDIDPSFLGDSLSGPLYQKKFNHIPKGFPKFPSRHTYQDTEVFTKREVDPRKVREQATEEGRLGEEALRKLARAAKDGETRNKERMKKRLWGRKKESMETMFDKTLKVLMTESATGAPKDGKAEKDKDKGLGLSFDLGLGYPQASTSQKPPPPNSPTPPAQFEMGPIVNCDRTYWRRDAFSDGRKTESEAAQSSRATHPVE